MGFQAVSDNKQKLYPLMLARERMGRMGYKRNERSKAEGTTKT